eukprot:gb/GECG01007938.1/.p1 GENE.gb/GECG01007938.1/~~gb/GECG01007938.1/.p1  ORF type:complete len:1021 (+),score=132.22 gb/GECG01007938.1/:1-3063(+)
MWAHRSFQHNQQPPLAPLSSNSGGSPANTTALQEPQSPLKARSTNKDAGNVMRDSSPSRTPYRRKANRSTSRTGRHKNNDPASRTGPAGKPAKPDEKNRQQPPPAPSQQRVGAPNYSGKQNYKGSQQERSQSRSASNSRYRRNHEYNGVGSNYQEEYYPTTPHRKSMQSDTSFESTPSYLTPPRSTYSQEAGSPNSEERHTSHGAEDDIDKPQGALYKRKDFLGVEEAAKLHPDRTYYYRKHVDVDRLIEQCTRKLEMQPNSFKALSIRASSYMKKKMYREAVEDYRLVLHQDPENVHAYYNKGIANDRVGNTEEAIEDFTEALKVDPDHVNAAYSRAACHNRMGNFSEAIDDYNMALTKDKARSSSSPKGTITSPAQNRKGSFLVGAEKYVKLREQQAREQLNQGLDPLGTPLSKATDGMPRTAVSKSKATGGFENDRRGRADSAMSAATTATGPTDDSVTVTLNYGRDGPYRGVENEASNDSANQSFNSERDGHLKMEEARQWSESYDKDVTYSSSHGHPSSYNTPPSSQGLASDEKPRDGTTSSTRSRGSPKQRSPQKQLRTSQQSADADKYHAQGFACRKKGDFRGAIEAYTQAIYCDSNHFKAYFNRGFALDKIERFSEAIRDYTAALRLDPSNAYAYYNRGISYDRNDDFESAIEDFSKAIERLPSNADFYHNRGFCHRKQGNFEAAINDYSQALERMPNHFKAVYNRAYCYERLNRLTEALKDYDTAVSIDPTNMNAFFNRASVYEKLGRIEDAIRDFDRAVELDTENASVYNSRGLAKDRAGMKEEVVADLTKAIRIEPSNGVYRHNRGFYYRSIGKYEEAIEDFTAALKLDPRNAAAYNHRGYSWRKLGDFAKAIDDYTQALTLEPENVKALNNRGYCYAKSGQYENAIKDYSRVLEIDPENAHAYHNRGISFDKKGEFVAAIQDFTCVLNLDPSNANAHFNRGSTHDSLGQYDKAIEDYSKALSLDRQQGHSQAEQGSLPYRNSESTKSPPGTGYKGIDAPGKHIHKVVH